MFLEMGDDCNPCHVRCLHDLRRNFRNLQYSMHNYNVLTMEQAEESLVPSPYDYTWLLISGTQNHIKRMHNREDFIGLISLNEINYVNRNAELRFMIDVAYWGKGHATQAGLIVLKYAFQTLGMHKVYLGCAEVNEPMKKVAEKIGMHYECRFLEHLYIEGQFVDIMRYSIFKSIWEKNNGYI